MTPLQMAVECAQAAAQGCGAVLVVPKGGVPKGFPRGELLNERERGGVVERTYRFEPDRVLAWLVRNSLITVERGEGLVLRISAPPCDSPAARAPV